MGYPQDDERTMLTPPSFGSDISDMRPVPAQRHMPRTVALGTGEHPPAPPPRTITLGDAELGAIRGAAEPPRAGPSLGVILALSLVMFLFTAGIGFCVVYLALA